MKTESIRRAAAAPILIVCLGLMALTAACSGGDSPQTISFTVTGVDPDVSTDLSGGDVVTVTGTNFQLAQVSNVTFGASPGFNLNVLSETELTVTAPPAPGGQPGTVTIEVFSLQAGSKLLFNAYTYIGGGTNPQPQTITPTTFTPTGAETFTIQGTNLGTPGGSVNVIFAGIGTVSAQVSQTATVITGRAPVSPGVPPAGPLTVTVDTTAAQADVPTQVSYAFALPTNLGMAFQSNVTGGASQPVALAPGIAIVCTSGTDATWGNNNDEIFLVKGPPNTLGITRVPGPAGGAVGYLDAANSIPAVLDANTFAVFSIGPDGRTATNDDGFILVTSAQGVPVATRIAPVTTRIVNTAPVAAVSSNRVALTTWGPDGFAQTADDEMIVMTITGTTAVGTALPNIGAVDITPGRGNLSIPFSADGDAVFVLTAGPDTFAGTRDDIINKLTVSTGVFATPANFPDAAQRPVALSATAVVAPAAGMNGILGDNDDVLTLVQDVTGTLTITRQQRLTPDGATYFGVATAAVRPMARLGAAGVAVASTGPVLVTTDPTVAGLLLPLSMVGTPLLAGLGSGDLIVYGPGPDLTPGIGNDDTLVRLDGMATSAANFATIPVWSQVTAVLTDADRGFAVGPGPDGSYGIGGTGTGDEQLLVSQSRALGQFVDGSVLPLTLIGQIFGPLATTPFTPVGPGWGLIQSAGTDRGVGSSDDLIVVAFY